MLLLQGAVTLTAACAPHFGLLKILFLEHHVTTRQSKMTEKEKTSVQTLISFDVSSIACEIVDNQLLNENVTQ